MSNIVQTIDPGSGETIYWSQTVDDHGLPVWAASNGQVSYSDPTGKGGPSSATSGWDTTKNQAWYSPAGGQAGPQGQMPNDPNAYNTGWTPPPADSQPGGIRGFVGGFADLAKYTAPMWVPAVTMGLSGLAGGAIAGDAAAGSSGLAADGSPMLSSYGANAGGAGIGADGFGAAQSSLGLQASGAYPGMLGVPSAAGAGSTLGAGLTAAGAGGSMIAPGYLGAAAAGLGGLAATGAGGVGAAGGGAASGLGTTAATAGTGAALSKALQAAGISSGVADTIAGLGPLLGAGAGALAGSQNGAKQAGTITQVQDIPAWQKPYVTGAFDQAKQVYDTQQGAQSGYQPLYNQAQGALTTAINGGPANPSDPYYTGLANYSNPNASLLQPTANGAYLNPSSNPYIQATYDQAARGLTNSYNSSVAPQTAALFANNGAFGGSNSAYNETVARNQFGLGQNLANLGTNIFGQNYQFERGNQLNAQNTLANLSNADQAIRATGAGGLASNFSGAQGRAITAAGVAPQFAGQVTQNAFGPINAYSGIVGQRFGQTNTSPYFTNPVGGALSGALTGGALGSLFGR